MLQEFLAFKTQFRGLPSAIYEDPYIWGYLASVTIGWLDLVYAESSQTDFSADEKARVARGAVSLVAGMSVKRYLAIRHTLTGSDTVEGMRQAQKMIAVMCGRLGAGDDPEVAEAFKGAFKLMPNESPAVGAAGILKRNYLGRRIHRILNEKSHREDIDSDIQI
jgi:hypothetical protein